jgi:hypothetical protein
LSDSGGTFGRAADLREITQAFDEHAIMEKTPAVDKRGHEPAGLRTKRRMRESKECELSSAYVNAFVQHFLESLVEDDVVRSIRMKQDLPAIFVAELNPNKVIMVVRVLSKDAIVVLWLGTK